MLLQIPDDLKAPQSDDATREIEVAADWLEASVLFSRERVTKPDISDLLTDVSIFDDRAAAIRFIDDVWATLRLRRQQQNGGGPFDFDYQDMHLAVTSWRAASAHAFCLLLSYEPPKQAGKRKTGREPKERAY